MWDLVRRSMMAEEKPFDPKDHTNLTKGIEGMTLYPMPPDLQDEEVMKNEGKLCAFRSKDGSFMKGCVGNNQAEVEALADKLYPGIECSMAHSPRSKR
jgi:hypothetical protein